MNTTKHTDATHAPHAAAGHMSSREIIDTCKKYSLFSWSATGKVDPLPIVRAEGIYLYGPEGQRWIDFNSQLMSVNIGHGHPKVIKAIQDQAATLAYAYPGMATEIRARMAVAAEGKSTVNIFDTKDNAARLTQATRT